MFWYVDVAQIKLRLQPNIIGGKVNTSSTTQKNMPFINLYKAVFFFVGTD